LYCEGNEDFENSCPSGQRCVREADCDAGIEGEFVLKTMNRVDQNSPMLIVLPVLLRVIIVLLIL